MMWATEELKKARVDVSREQVNFQESLGLEVQRDADLASGSTRREFFASLE